MNWGSRRKGEGQKWACSIFKAPWVVGSEGPILALIWIYLSLSPHPVGKICPHREPALGIQGNACSRFEQVPYTVPTHSSTGVVIDFVSPDVSPFSKSRYGVSQLRQLPLIPLLRCNRSLFEAKPITNAPVISLFVSCPLRGNSPIISKLIERPVSQGELP